MSGIADLRRFQLEYGAWGRSAFPDATRDSLLSHLRDELKELEDEVAGLGHGGLGVEAGDCFLLLVHFCERTGIDLEREVEARVGKAVGGVEGTALMGSVSALQRSVEADVRHNHPMATPMSLLRRLEGQVALLHGARAGDCPSPGELAADCLVTLLQFCALTGVELAEEAVAKFQVNKARTWGRADSRGVVRHVGL